MLRRIRLAQLMMDKACRKFGRPIRIMEICGTHTVSIFRNAIRESIPPMLKILSGPGCSVCVTDTGLLEQIFSIAQRKDVILATRGDLLSVPVDSGRQKLMEIPSTIAVTSILEAIELAKIHQNKTVVFAAIGFGICVPGTAVAIEQAQREGVDNFCIISGLKEIVPAMKALLTEKNHQIDAFLCCGNMSAISGYDIYNPIMNEFNVPCLPTGFEPMQLIEGIAEICRQLIEGKASQCYDFAVSLTAEGNKIAQKYTADYFDVVDDYWRGFGKIEKSALRLKDKYDKFDAHKRFGIKRTTTEDVSGCRCGEVICGIIEPRQCDMYGKECTRQNPLGPCMASSEGACRTWQKYSRK